MTDTPTPSPSTPTRTPRKPRTPWRVRLARLVLVVYWPLLATATHWPSFSLTGAPPPPRTEAVSLIQGDKAGHLVTFSLLAVLLTLARPIGVRRSPRANRFAAAGIALGYALVDELTQSLAFERTVSISDFLANAIAIVGVLLVAMTPPTLDDPPAAEAVRSARRRWAVAVAGIVLGGLVLAMSGTVNRETMAVHFVAGAALTLMLLRAAPVWPSRPRVSVVLACGGVGGAIAGAEIAQGFVGLPFSHAEAFYGQVGLVLAMALWSVRLGVAPPAAYVQDASGAAEPADDASEPTDAVPAPPPRA